MVKLMWILSKNLSIPRFFPVDNSVDNVDYFIFYMKAVRRNMDGEVYELILRSAQDHGVLPLTSVCNVACEFCSNRQNPQNISTFDIGILTMDQIREVLTFMTPEKKIIIGESATRINEGEPFTHPDFPAVLRLIRKSFPETLIQITTNGSLVTDSMAALLKEMNPIEVYLSLNSSSVSHRFRIMRDSAAQQAVQVPALFAQYGIHYHGSLVAQPDSLGWDDMEATIRVLAEEQASTIRIFTPGYTRWHCGNRIENVSNGQLTGYARAMTAKYSVPVLAEPPDLNDLTPVLEGVVPNSPAAQAGLMPGDVMESVAGVTPWSRNHAFHLCYDAPSPDIVFTRQHQRQTVKLKKTRSEPGGVVFYDDMNLQRMLDAKHRLAPYQDHRVLILTSNLARAVVAAAARSLLEEQNELMVIPVPSLFWGGTIQAAGLLTVSDFIAAVKEVVKVGDVLVLPREPFDHRGMDLTGQSYLEVENTVACEVILV
jgi:NifB/MoaA-like Fe-S oxidoreductase